jgi:phosphoglycerate dehydrogenase-like enzyme
MRKALIAIFLVLESALLLAAQQKKVVVTIPGTGAGPLGPEGISELRAAAPDINLVAPDKERMMAELADADGVIGIITPEMIRAAKKLKWVQVVSAGVERYLSPELVNSDIMLTNCKIVQGPEIADHAMAMLLALTRGLYRAIPARTQEEWAPREFNPVELLGKTAVVIGVGGIGTQIAVRAHASGMRVLGVDPREMPYAPYLERCVFPDRLDTLLPEADVVFISAPHTPESEKMMGAKQFALMKKGAYFICVSRGKLYDMAALVNALETKQLAGAGVDVTDPEPLPKGHPLWKFENVVITPHIAGRSDGRGGRYLALFKENLRRFSADEQLVNVVDKQKGY